MKMHRYQRQGALAINPRAFLDLFAASALEDTHELVDGAAVVSISGPLDHHAGWWCDSYEAIRERFDAACEASGVIVLKIDSPGGDVSGCFELARHMREMAAAGEKRLVAYVDGQACSAAYALACAASEIVVPPSGFVGSIGVIEARADLTAADQAYGVKMAFTRSGKRKADGNPHQPISEAELAEAQDRVDGLAALFFDWVRETRELEAAPLEARVFHGQKAVAARLADRVDTFDGLIASLSNAPQEETMSLKAATKALQAAAKGTGADAEKARAALKALGASAEDEKPEDDAEDEKPEDDASVTIEVDEPKDDAESDDEEDEKEDDASASASVEAAAGSLAGTVAALKAEVDALKARNRRSAVRSLFAARPDVPAEVREALKDLPVAKVKAVLAGMPRKKIEPAAAAGTAPATAGETQTNQGAPGAAPQLPPDQAARMRAQMGLASVASRGVEHTPHTLVLGKPVPVDTTARKEG